MTSRAEPVIFTIGYEKASIDDILYTLEEAGVEILVDIQAKPNSTKQDFTKRYLEKFFESQKIDYRSMPQLGMPTEGRYRAGIGDYEKAWDIYERSVLEKKADVMQQLIDLATNIKVCLMCYESSAFSCHRHFTAQATGLNVYHLPIKKRRKHDD